MTDTYGQPPCIISASRTRPRKRGEGRPKRDDTYTTGSNLDLMQAVRLPV